MPARERRFWPRAEVHEHILGEIRWVEVGRSRVRALWQYEQSVERNQEPDDLPDTRSRIIGDVDAICCTICKRPVADWHIGEDAMEILISRVIGGV
jgi:hypothetical protein